MSIKVIVVDDSALIRALLTQIIDAEPDMHVVATAPDAFIARDLVKRYEPDVMTLDIEMPKMHGLEFLKRLMHGHPMPVIMISSLTDQNSDFTFQALELGAVDFFHKPTNGSPNEILIYADVIVEKIRAAASANIHRRTAKSIRKILCEGKTIPELLAIGASTGGTEAILRLLHHLPNSCPGIVIVQHMPAGFTASFAERLNRQTSFTVKEAEGGERIRSGLVFIAPGDKHLLIKKVGIHFYTELEESEPVNRHKPSVDKLFNSIADCAATKTVAILLTGMGKDGAIGMLKLKEQGAFTVAQDEESCVVFGMPREAIAIDAASEVLALDHIGPTLAEFFDW